MGGEVLKEFLARLGFQVDQASYSKFNASLASSTVRMAAFGAVVQAAGAAIWAGVYKVAEGQKELLQASERTGVSVERLQELQYVAEQTGASAASLVSSLKGLQQAMAGATIGQGGLATFARLGIRIKDANGKLRDTSEVLADVGEKVKKLDRPRAQMFLGQLGIDPELLEMMTQDVSGLTEAYREMYRVSGVDAQKAAEDSKDFVNAVKSIKTVFGLVAKSVAFSFIGKMGEDIERLKKRVTENFAKISNTFRVILGVVMRIASAFGELSVRIMKWVGDIVEWFDKLDGGTQKLILGIVGFAAAWKVLNLSFLATPLGAIIAGVAALVLLIDDFQTYMEGGESLIDWGPWVPQILAISDALKPLMEDFGKLWDMLKGPLADGFKIMGEGAIEIIKGLLGVFVNLISTVVGLLNGDWGAAWTSALQLIEKVWETVKGVIKFLGLKDIADNIVDHMVGKKDAPALGPSPAFAVAGAGAAGGGGRADITASTVINIDGAGDPAAVAMKVAEGQNRVNADLVRHTRGAVR